jgi:hypothetical protein
MLYMYMQLYVVHDKNSVLKDMVYTSIATLSSYLIKRAKDWAQSRRILARSLLSFLFLLFLIIWETSGKSVLA